MSKTNKKFSVNKQQQLTTNDGRLMSPYETGSSNDGSEKVLDSRQVKTTTSDSSQQTSLSDRTRNRIILKERLREIRLSENNSITNSYNVADDTIELTKTENGAIVFKEQDNSDYDDNVSKIKNTVLTSENSRRNDDQDSNNSEQNEGERYEEEVNDYMSDEEEFKRLEEFYKREGGFYDESNIGKIHSQDNSFHSTESPIANTTVDSIIINNEVISRSIITANTLQTKSSVNRSNKKNETEHELSITSKSESLKYSLSKESLSDENDDENVNNLNKSFNSIKYSTPIPPKSAPVGKRRIAVNKLLEKFKTLNSINIKSDGNDNKIIDNKGVNLNDEIVYDFKRVSLNEVSTTKAELDENMNEPVSSNASLLQDSTFSDYNLRELMKSETELDISVEIIDPEIFEIVCSVMDRMLKRVCRKWYLYNVGVYKPLLDRNDSTLWFFTSQDHLYDNRLINTQNFGSIDVLNFDLNDDIDTSTEISESESNNFFSYLKLNLDEEKSEQPVVADNQNDKNDVLSYISSEEDVTMNEDEIRLLNNQLKDEVRLVNYWILNTNISSIKAKLIELKNNEIQSFEKISSRILHDDYFFTEYDETKLNFVENGELNLNTRFTSDTGQANHINSPSNRITEVKHQPKSHIQKRESNKKREDRIKLMQKAFSAQTSQKGIKNQRLMVGKSSEKYRKPQMKSNIKIIQVPQNYKQVKSSRLPEIQSAKSLPPIGSRIVHSAFKTERAKTAPASGPIDERQKYPRPISTKQPWGTIVHPPYGLGYQRMTEYEIKQSVNRLYYIPKKKDDPPRSISCLSRTDFYHMVDRLTNGSSDKAADRCRTQEASMYNSIGILNSYAWKGY